MAQPDYYAVLGVAESSSNRDIKDAYRQLAFKYHPDRNSGTSGAADKMKAVNEAYAVLSDTGKRAEYDALKNRYGSSATRHFRTSYTEQDIFRDSDIQQIFEEMARAFGLRGGNEIFREFYGTHQSGFKMNRPGMSARGTIFSSHIGEKRDANNLRRTTFGLGKLTGFLLKLLAGISLPQKGRDIHDVITISREFAMSGGSFAYHHRRRTKKLVITIPTGVKEGQKIRLAGMGEDGNADLAGDLYLKVQYRKPLLEKIKHFINAIKS
ncbi:MAG: DnaJ domain-containing protein [Desulfobacteraceae bacterium]|nr:DnaJ domain-containing protein [Desulfobacteraceae bacterium]